jgi:hypothetical protein
MSTSLLADLPARLRESSPRNLLATGDAERITYA